MGQVVPNLALHQRLVAAEAQAYMEQAQDYHCCCPHCGSFTRHLGVAAAPGIAAPLAVHLCTQLAIHPLQLQPVQCTGCHALHYPTPPELRCLPGTANAFTQLRRDVVLVWFSYDLLQHVDSAVFVERDQSMYKYVEVRQPVWLSSHQARGWQPAADGSMDMAELPPSYQGQQLPLTADALRRQLGAAAREYAYAQSMLDTLSEGLEGWPGKANPCAACHPAHVHLSFDMCFKVELLKRKGYSLDYPQPPNSRRFVSNAAAAAHLAAIDSDVQQQRLSQQAAAAAAAVPARVPILDSPTMAEGLQGSSTAARAAATPAASSVPALDSTDPVTTDSANLCEGPACSDRFAADNLAAAAPKGVSTVGLQDCSLVTQTAECVVTSPAVASMRVVVCLKCSLECPPARHMAFRLSSIANSLCTSLLCHVLAGSAAGHSPGRGVLSTWVHLARRQLHRCRRAPCIRSHVVPTGAAVGLHDQMLVV
jgi:hypothetical protein